MGKKIVAEFVENEAILSKLREIGVDYAQGYGICKPQALDEVLAVPVRKNLKLIQARGSQSASPSIVTLPSTKQKK